MLIFWTAREIPRYWFTLMISAVEFFSLHLYYSAEKLENELRGKKMSVYCMIKVNDNLTKMRI